MLEQFVAKTKIIENELKNTPQNEIINLNKLK